MAPAKIVVCGTGFGYLWIDSISKITEKFELAGVVARGSGHSKAVCHDYRIPLFTDVASVKGLVDAAVVAVGGRSGEEIALAWLKRGVPVLVEHPVRRSFLMQIKARRSRFPPLIVNGHFSDLPDVREFIRLCRSKVARVKRYAVTVVAKPRTLYSSLDIAFQLFSSEDLIRLIDLRSWSGRPAREQLHLGPMNLLTTLVNSDLSVDDSAASIGGHFIECWLPNERLILAGPSGPIITLSAESRRRATWKIHSRSEGENWGNFSTQTRPAALIRALRRLLKLRSASDLELIQNRDMLVSSICRKLLIERITLRGRASPF